MATCRKGAEAGDAADQYKLAICLQYGKEGEPKDAKQCVSWLAKSAAQGHPEAQHDYGMYLRHTDKTAAFELLHKAAEKGLAKAQVNLSQFYVSGLGVQKDEDAAVFWLK